MYAALWIVLFAMAILLGALGYQRNNRFYIGLGITVFLATILFFIFLEFWGEVLWFRSLDYSERFWTVFQAQAGIGALGAAVGAIFTWILTLSTPQKTKQVFHWPQLLGAISGGIWGFNNWDLVLRFMHKVPTQLKEPIFNKSTSFYMFSLPLWDSVHQILVFLSLIGLAYAGIYILTQYDQKQKVRFSTGMKPIDRFEDFKPLFLPLGIFALCLSWGFYLDTYHLLYSQTGTVTGAGWTDVNIKYPGLILVSIIVALTGIFFLIPQATQRLHSWILEKKATVIQANAIVIIIPVAVASLIWILGTQALPGFMQWIQVEPNEITYEKPYIQNNIKFTRHGFDLHQIEEKEFPVSEDFNQEMAEENEHLLSEVRLWDPRALDAVYKQFQEIRSYYEFHDVDIDRYQVGNKYRQMMVSAREMRSENLPEKSQTFVNKRFKYTHGYGLTMTPVSDFTSNGLPDLYVKDIPPKSIYPSLNVEKPQIYYGELTDTVAVVNSTEPEFDFPRGDENAYFKYDGSGGVQLSNWFRKFIYGWKFDGTKLFLSNYPHEKSRIMFRRNIEERVNRLAPFLNLDKDPYVVLSQGEIYWIIDAYTTSTNFPYSASFTSQELMQYSTRNRDFAQRQLVNPQMYGKNYIRNSVKVVVNAFSGEVDFYVFEQEDPLISVWQKIFPEMFQPKSEMPKHLFQHVRYPADYLLTQGLVYAKYHMTDPEVFYNQEDLWVRATEQHYGRVEQVEPYYVMWEPPGSDEQEFILMLPFTPKNRQVMIGWIAGMCDWENYGRFLSYKFPKEKRVLGPQQVESKIDQNSYLSRRLSLWDQKGSNVLRGNVLAIPVGDTILYVEPIYIEADTAAYPELRMVVAMHQDELSYGESFEQALQGLFPDKKVEKELPGAKKGKEIQKTMRNLSTQANQAFKDYLRLQSEGRFRDAGDKFDTLKETLEEMVRRTKNQTGETRDVQMQK